MLRRIFDWFMERIKAFSDTTLAFLLRSTSWFGRELTQEGRAEQDMWREQSGAANPDPTLIGRRNQLC